ncbi:MAG: hypothetical protein ABWX67_16315 [Allosphingosinicella sp.]
MAAKTEAARVEAAQETFGGGLRAVAFEPEFELVAGALESDARPTPASNLIERESRKVDEVDANRLQESGGGVGQRRRWRFGRDGAPGARSTRSI